MVIGWLRGDQSNYVPWTKLFVKQHRFLIAIRSNGGLYLEKPPGMFWVVALYYKLFGMSDIVLKSVMLTLILINAWLLYGCERLLQQVINIKSVSVIAPMILLSNPFYCHFALQLRYENFLMPCILLSFYGLLRWQILDSILGLCLWALGLGYGLLVKGPVILVFALPLLAVLKIPPKQKNILCLPVILSTIACLIPLMVWYFAVMVTYPKNVWLYLIHHPSDYIGWLHFHLNTVVNLMMHFLLWALLLTGSGAVSMKRLLKQHWFVLVLTQIPVLLFFSIFMNFYASRFMLPAYPILSLALAVGYFAYWECDFTLKQWVPYLLALPLILWLIFALQLIHLKHTNFQPFSFAAFILALMSIVSLVALVANYRSRNNAFLLTTSASCLLAVVVH